MEMFPMGLTTEAAASACRPRSKGEKGPRVIRGYRKGEFFFLKHTCGSQMIKLAKGFSLLLAGRSRGLNPGLVASAFN